jgi:uncharacterized protein
VVLVGGSGPSDRDNGGLFISIQSYLADRGIAVLSYDKRGSGGSEGVWASATLDELASDAAGGLNLARARPEIDAGRVTLFGHSEGGWVALRTSVTSEPPRQLILNATPAASFLRSEIYALASYGLSEDESRRAGDLLTDLVQLAESGADAAAARAFLLGFRATTWFDRFEEAGFSLTDSMWSQLSVWGRYDPESDLRRCTVPTVAFLGGADPLVPVHESIETYNRTASTVGRHQINRLFPAAGHRMNLPGSDEFTPGYLEEIAVLCAG